MTIQSIKDSNLKNISEQIISLWNNEYGWIYPITSDLYKKNSSDINIEASFIAVEEDNIIGFILCKTWENDFEMHPYETSAWINLMYVCPKYRKKGIGSSLLENTTNIVKSLGKNVLNLGKDVNCYFPALPEDLKSSQSFFQNRGFDSPYQTHDLINLNPVKLELRNKEGYSFRLGTIDDKENLIKFLKDNWPGRWTYEALWYFENGGTGKEYMLCLDENEKIVGFAKLGFPSSETAVTSYSMTWRARFSRHGGVGPLGVTKDLRGKGLGRDIVVAGINALIYEEVSDIIIDWTGLLDFYRKMGFEVWKVYNYMSKSL